MKFPRLLPKNRIVRRAIQLALLAACIVLPFGCNADTLVLGGNHEKIDPGGARRTVIDVEGRAVECWIARSPGAARIEPRAFVLYFIGKGDRADRWIDAIAGSWENKPVEVW